MLINIAAYTDLQQDLSNSNDLMLYVTPENVLFLHKSGFVPVQFYKKIGGTYRLFSLSESTNRFNRGIYSKDSILYCKTYKNFSVMENYHPGDTLIPLNALCDSSPAISLFNQHDFFEQQVSVVDYVQVMLCRFQERIEGERTLTLIIHPSIQEFALLNSIETVVTHMGFRLIKNVTVFKKADDWIKENFPDGDVPDAQANDSISKAHYQKLKEMRRMQKSKR
jgi:hypothetical protein